MPYPAQVTRERIIETARELIERDGFDQLSLARLAEALHIKAPSLYRHVSSKGDLLREVNLETSQRLIETLHNAAETTPEVMPQLLALASAYRDFAHANPATYMLAFSNTFPESRPDAAVLANLALPIQAAVAPLSGEENSLTALRGLFALIHGFVMLELNEQFQRGGDLDVTFMRVVETYLRGWQR
jgi:AcrR family transcriptional regulator